MRPILLALGRYCSFGFGMRIELVYLRMSFNREIHKLCIRWKVVTRADTKLILEVQVQTPKQWPLNVTDDVLVDKMHQVLEASAKGFEARIARLGVVETR